MSFSATSVRIRPAKVIAQYRPEQRLWAVFASRAMKLTEAEVNNALRGRLVIGDDVVWQTKRNHPDFVTCELRIHHESEGEMRLHMNVSLTTGKSTFTILYRGQCVKRLDIKGSHRNSCRDRNLFINQTHKHLYTDQCRDSWAYAPSDITSDDPAVAFPEFCVECGIIFEGTWHGMPQSPLDLS